MIIKATVGADTYKKLDGLKRAINEPVALANIDTFMQLKSETPVLTGFARDHWFMDSEGSIQIDSYGAPVEVAVGGITRIYNTAPYIGLLADGYSSQAQPGWIEAIAAAYNDLLNKHVLYAYARI